MKTINTALLTTLFAAGALISLQTHANPNHSLAASVQMGANAAEYQVGWGGWQRGNSHAQMYVSYFESEDTYKVDGSTIGKYEYTSARIGFIASGFGKGQGEASEGGFFLYKNESAQNIDRYGIGLQLMLGKMLGARTRIQAGVTLMPEFASSDWDAKALLEYELKAGLNYRLTRIVDIGVHYRYGATLDDIDVTHYNQIMGGISLKL